MKPASVELALARVLAYLRLSGVPLTQVVMLEALALVRDALTEGGPTVLLVARVMQKLPEHFSLPAQPLYPVAPPIRRGSIQYGS